MITPKQIEEATMSPEKRAMAHNDYFAFYIGRPLSYALTIPFLYSPLSPNQVTMISIIPLLVGLVLMYIGNNMGIFLCGWLCFFLWNLLDGVDGNMARYRKQFSKMGGVWDAMAGYIAMILSPLAWGIAASHQTGWLQEQINLPTDIYIILGALSGVSVIFPRFIMHKTITTIGKNPETDSVKDKSNYGFSKTLALNVISVTGFMQVFMLISIFFKAYDIFTLAYFIINVVVMFFSLRTIFNTK